MDNFIEKMPNWLRYLLSIPTGILCYIICYYIFAFGIRWVASYDSIMFQLYLFLYPDCIGLIAFFTGINYILPKYKFSITFILSLLYSAIIFIGLGFSIFTQDITVTYVISIIISLVTLIIYCLVLYKEKEIVDYTLQEKYNELANCAKTLLNVNTIDETLYATIDFYKSQGVDTNKIKINYSNKEKTISELIMLGLCTNNIDFAIAQTKEFYNSKIN